MSSTSRSKKKNDATRKAFVDKLSELHLEGSFCGICGKYRIVKSEKYKAYRGIHKCRKCNSHIQSLKTLKEDFPEQYYGSK